MGDSFWVRTFGICSTALGLLAFVYGLPQPAGAESMSPSSGSAVSEDQLDAFARSYVRLGEVRDDYVDHLDSAEAQSNAAEDTVEVLADEGLTPQQYNRILSVVNSDPSLRDQAMKKIEAER